MTLNSLIIEMEKLQMEDKFLNLIIVDLNKREIPLKVRQEAILNSLIIDGAV
jgi:hypothetical protein